MHTRLGLLLVAAALAGCASQRAEEPRIPTSFPPEMERLADVTGRAWHACLARSFPVHIGRGLDPDTAAEAALASCQAEERSYMAVGVRAGIPVQRVQTSMQILRLEQKQIMLRAHAQAAARSTPAGRPAAPARRPAPRSDSFTPLVPGAAPPPPRQIEE